MYEFDWSAIPPSLPCLMNGLVVTLKIALVAVVFGIVWGTILAMMRLSSFKPISWFAKLYVNLFRSVPLVMVLVLVAQLLVMVTVLVLAGVWEERKLAQVWLASLALAL